MVESCPWEWVHTERSEACTHDWGHESLSIKRIKVYGLWAIMVKGITVAIHLSVVRRGAPSAWERKKERPEITNRNVCNFSRLFTDGQYIFKSILVALSVFFITSGLAKTSQLRLTQLPFWLRFWVELNLPKFPSFLHFSRLVEKQVAV